MTPWPRSGRSLPAPAARLAGRAAGRVAEGIGLDELHALRGRVEGVAEAVAENTALAGPLERRVAALEGALLPLLERPATGAATAPADDS